MLHFRRNAINILKLHQNLGKSRRNFVSWPRIFNTIDTKLDIVNPIAFGAGSIGAIFIGAMIFQEEKSRYITKKLKLSGRSLYNWTNIPMLYRKMIIHTSKNQIRVFWHKLLDWQRCVYPLIGINCLVYALSAMGRLSFRSFSYLPQYSKPYSMFLSCFAHANLPHLLINMFCLYMFGKSLVPKLGEEQFMAVYLSAGIFSQLAGHFLKLLRGSFRFGRYIELLPTVGASGGIMSLVALTALYYPMMNFTFIFFPFVSFTSNTMLYSLAAFDTIGYFMPWSSIDHAVHLGGLLFGLLYYSFQYQIWMGYRYKFISAYRKFRPITNL